MSDVAESELSVFPEGFQFPEGFLIGASTSAHQTEGGNTNSDWWALETLEPSPLAEPSGDACDSYNRWDQDMDLAAAAGLNSYRFSVEWARVEPEDGEFSGPAIEHYRLMVAGAKQRGLKPVLTLHHFTNPLWFAQRGGWLAPDSSEKFARYAAALAPVIDEGAVAVVTINEPNMGAIMHRVMSGAASLGTGLGGLLPLPDPAVSAKLIEAHHVVAAQLRSRHNGLPVGWSVANQSVQWVAGGQEQAENYREAIEDIFVRAAVGDDFIGVQAYTRTVIGPNGKIDQGGRTTITGWEFYPQALADSIRHVAQLLPNVPQLVTENGIATADDSERIEYTSQALAGLGEAMAEGAAVRGYLHWSLLDNYEWGHWGPTFGLISVDRKTFQRTAKPSLAWLGRLARTTTS